ncbi:hypothetical protein [Legionella jordanis]|nr:hypothetical protein [Legionella jordanis]
MNPKNNPYQKMIWGTFRVEGKKNYRLHPGSQSDRGMMREE